MGAAARTARDWMSSVVYTVSRTAPAAELARILAARRVTSLPVLDGERVVGVVSRSDLASCLAHVHSIGDAMLDDLMPLDRESSAERSDQLAEFIGRRLGGKRVEELMTAPAIAVAADDDMRDVARVLLEHKIHHAPVLDAEKLVGVISTFDIARWAAH